jgi:hypothetical protein
MSARALFYGGLFAAATWLVVVGIVYLVSRWLLS